MILTLTPNIGSAVSQELADGSPFDIDSEGFDLPIPGFDEDYVESVDMEGGRRVRSRPQNPSGAIPLVAKHSASSAAFYSALSNLQQTIETIRTNRAPVKGFLAYTPDNGTIVTYDLESIWISGLKQDRLIRQNIARPVLAFVCRPFGRLAPVSLVSNATSSDPIQSVSLSGVTGSAPALISATVTDTSGNARDHLEGAIDDDWDGSAPLLIDSASLSTTGLAGSTTTRSGAYASSGVIRATLATQAVGICEATGLTHRNKQRIKARVYGSGTGPIYVRLAYRIGSGPWTRDQPWAIPLLGAFSEIDLKFARCNPSGTLTVRVEAYSDTPGDTLDVDYLLVLPTAKYLKARAVAAEGIPPAPAFSYSDAFNQTAGALSGKTADAGGNWSTAGATTDFAVVAGSSHNLTRSASGIRFATLGAALEAQAVQVNATVADASTQAGILLRYVDTSNYMYAAIDYKLSSAAITLRVATVVAGVTTVLYTGTIDDLATRKLLVSVIGGKWTFAAGLATGRSSILASGYSSALDTGGALASGKAGIYHQGNGSTTNTFDNFAAWVPEVQHVVNASGAVVVDNDSIQRSDGARPPSVTGDYLTCPPAGREGRTHRLAVKMRRNDVDTLPDDQIADGQRIDITVTPRVVLF